MTHVQPSVEPVESVDRLSDPDPFQLARNVHQRVRCCTQANCGGTEEITYLWIDLSHSESTNGSLCAEDWFNVVDEAASLGVSWVVFSLENSPSHYPAIWDICQWAQDSYGMVAGIHLRAGSLSIEDINAIKRLDSSRCHVFVPQETIGQLQNLSGAGLSIHPADVEHDHRDGLCSMPGNMVFVKPDGTLYTCGMVKQNRDYLLGHILERKLNHIVRDPSLPHAVPEQAAADSRGCDGCPPLVARQVQR